MYVCSAHFRSEDYIPTLSVKRRTLKLGAVPSQNLPKRRFDKILTPEEERKVKERRKRVINRQISRESRLKVTPMDLDLEVANAVPENNSESSTGSWSITNLNEVSSTPRETVDSNDGVSSQCNSSANETCEENAEDNESLEMSAAKALVELHERVNVITIETRQTHKTYGTSEIDNENVNLNSINGIDNEEYMMSKNNIVKIGEKVCHAIHNNRVLTLPMLLKTDNNLKCFTGINFQLLKNLADAVKDAEGKKCHRDEISIEDRITLCLCKLKLNLSFKCLAVLFGVSRLTCSRLFLITLHTLAYILEDAVIWPTKEQILKSMPKCFEFFKKTYIILDCTEVPVDKPKCLYCKLRLYSHYKGCETIKILIGCSPSGAIIYCRPFGGPASDKAIFNQSGILQKLMPTRDAIMVDKGFAIEDECAQGRIELIMPPKLAQRKQMTAQEVTKTKKIAAARVHVDRVMQRLKLYQILRTKISQKTVPYMNEILKVICGLVNLSNPILKDDKF